MWVRVSNAVQDPVTSTALAQDQVVRVVSQEDDWYSIETLDGEKGRLPKILANEIINPLRSNTESVYCSIAPFEAEREDDLAFGLFSILVVESAESEGWFRGVVVTDNGKRLGSSGNIPATYVKQLIGFETPAASSNIPSSFTSDFSTDIRFQNVAPYARAVYHFAGEFENELTFAADELIQLVRRIDAEWLEGRIENRTGIFPQTFVQIVVPLEGENTSSESQPSPGQPDTSDGIGYAIVRHSFDGRQKDELSVKIGDSIRVLRMANNDWVECKDPATDCVGIVPVSFLELYLDEDDDETKNKADSFTTLNNQSFSAASVLSDWRTSTRVEDTSAINNSTFRPNSTNVGWATFDEGLIFPPEKEKTSPPSRPPPPKKTTFSPPEENTFAGMLENVDRAIAHANGLKESIRVPLGSGNWLGTSVTGTNQEKRSKVLEELVNTELQYISDMNAFTEAVDCISDLTPKQKAILKAGCAQIVQLAGNLVLGLTNEQGKDFDNQAVGSCFLNLRKAFAQTYGYYFRNIEQINDLLNKAKYDSKLEGALNEIVRKMQDNGAQLIDYTTVVSRPVQRCVKYPLFLNELAKYTPIQHIDHPKLTEAIKQMSTLGQKMNESKRKKELAKKYSENQPSSSFTDMLSKFTVHTIKKKSNRFTYRMGSSLGVVKVTRDNDFDYLVNELDACERRLVRFNYTLVIYKKKIFFETRQLIQKRLIDIRKRQVVLQGVDIEREIQPFHDEVKVFAEMLNSQVRDEIVKALRAIPKKMIKKRNDKLMDWESVKAKEKSVGPHNNKFLDFEALNAQVKQTVPKVIEVLHKVLRDSMDAVKIMDSNLMSELRRNYNLAAQADPSLDSYLSSHRLIVPNIPCFVDFYDHNRLAALQAIVNKAERKARNHAFISAEKAPKQRRGSTTSYQGREELPALISYKSPHLPNPPSTPSIDESTSQKRFRSQTEEERRTILQKAEMKGRQKEMYRVVTDWPATREGVEENAKSGRMLICKKGDAVLLVSKQKDGMCVCYNGYYNAFLPYAVMASWYPEDSKLAGIGLNRPHSTPPKTLQAIKTGNLIDLNDSPIENIPALQPSVYPSLTPLPFSTPHDQSTPILATASRPESIFDGVKPIDWGSSSTATNYASSIAEPSPFDTSLIMKTPSLPNLLSKPSLSFPVTFDDSPSDVPSSTSALTHLPPPCPSSSLTSTPTQDGFTTLWEQIKSEPLSKVTQRCESPLPLIPTRPETALQIFSTSVQPTAFDFAQFGSYDTVADDSSNSRQYNNIPFAQSAAQNNLVYDSPPSEMYAQPPSLSYDLPPVETIEDPYKNKPAIGTIRAMYDFISQDIHQISMRAGEKFQLLQAHDDFGSTEWILVRPFIGKSGYVPANYCSPC